jgi:hypothetical protein
MLPTQWFCAFYAAATAQIAMDYCVRCVDPSVTEHALCERPVTSN